MKNLLLIEGNGLAYRNFFSHKDLSIKENDKTHFTGMQYGVLNSLITMNKEFNPDRIIIVWDGSSQRRKKLYAGYKRKRMEKREKERKELAKLLELTPDTPVHNFINEFEETKNLINLIGVQQIQDMKEEADDVIGSIVHSLPDYKIMIASNDHDFNQLLKKDRVEQYINITNRNYHKSKIVTYESFYEEHKINPKFYPNVLAIGGDSTDEYPGVKGISEETAFRIVKEFGPKLSSIIENAKKQRIKPDRYSRYIVRDEGMIYIFKKLSKIIPDLKIPPDIEDKNDHKLLAFKLKELRFHSMLFKDSFSELIALKKKNVIFHK